MATAACEASRSSAGVLRDMRPVVKGNVEDTEHLVTAFGGMLTIAPTCPSPAL